MKTLEIIKTKFRQFRRAAGWGLKALTGATASAGDTAPPTDLVLAGPEPGVLQDVESPFLPPTAGGVSVDLSWGQT